MNGGAGWKRQTMARFQQIEDPEADSRLAAIYQQIVESGFGQDTPLNWFKSQSERPDILEATWRLTRALLLRGQLPPTVKQMIAVKIASQNHCRYCHVLHTSALVAMGVPREVIDSVTNDVSLAKLAPPLRAIVQFSLKTARDPQSITDDDLRGLEQHGLSRGEIMEVAMMAAFSNFINTWADVSDIAVDGEWKRP